ncbi:DUF397 domain-containing protein [Amycolatopsis sp. NPDC059021]|uniref:DUF397 domain-containing protein n=1 Tax=Amycolatopsis sp. NPDC059021 TaxID=3346704 RepID=UPI00366A822F
MSSSQIELGVWRTSSYSGDKNECVETQLNRTHVRLRDTKDRKGGQLTVEPEAFRAFLTVLR